ncbi:MAG: SPOR domain-containing protein [Erythrobacter sp.]|nr:MAG: SPOR domain-containing protein [Erythrobacter sp.]
MNAMQKRNPMLGLGVTTAMAAIMLSGCATGSAPTAAVSAAQAQQALATGQHGAAVQAAEAAVQADPRNAAHRMMLGNAYLEAGRFASASTSFEDAMALGDNSPRAALSLALALTGQARYAEASSLLSDWEGEIAASDLGLALALAGQPERGIHILTNAIRGGDNTVKSRQNLAYAYAVAGRWREARMMVAQDVPAHEVGDRMEEWAQMTHSEAYQLRVASLLGAPANVRDAGQPVHLALVNYPDAPQLAAEATQPSLVPPPPPLAALDAERMSIPASGGELPSVGAAAPRQAEVGLDTYAPPRAAAPANFAEAFVAEPPVASGSLAAAATETLRMVSVPAAQPASALQPAAAAPAAPRASAASAPRGTVTAATPAIARPVLAAAPASGSSHLVQLGSFSSEASARRAWGIYQSRHAELADRELVITQAVVNGRNYWRVSAGGFDRNGSRDMCSRVQSSSADGCISWAANSPLPGAIDTGVRMARR